MRGIGRPSALLTAALVWASGGTALLPPTPASAQFIPIPFIGVPRIGGGEYRHRSAPTNHSRSSSRREHEDQGEASDRSKEKDATQEQSSASTSGQHQQTSGAAHDSSTSRDSSKAPETDASAKPPAGSKTSEAPPEFTPSR